MAQGEEDVVAAVGRAAFENEPLFNKTIDLGLREAFTNATWRPRYWLAEIGNEVVGFGGWNWSWINYDVAVFNWAAVLEAHRGKGIGRGLVEARLADIRQTDPGISLVLVNTWNPAMYCRFGFETLGVHNFRSGEQEHLMRLLLNATANNLPSQPVADRAVAHQNEQWAVTVSSHGEQIITIESGHLSGREISDADEQTIRTAARHLLSFIGDPGPRAPDSALRAERDALREAAAWKHIETAPKDGTVLWGWQADRGQYECWWHDDWPSRGSYWMDAGDSEPEPTHWRTLPEPPRGALVKTGGA